MLQAVPKPSLPRAAARQLPSWTRDWPNLSVAGLIIVLSLYTSWVGWQALKGNDSLVRVAVTPVAVPVAALPTLKLNQSHQRLGRTIQVDPAAIGKSDPFSQ